MNFILITIIAVLLTFQYIILIIPVFDDSINDIITTKKMFWLFVIPLGILVVLFLELKTFYHKLK